MSFTGKTAIVTGGSRGIGKSIVTALAREGAEKARTSEARSHAALYRAIGLAYDFALVTRRSAEEYSELLEDYGIKAQARSPMTAVIKLVFGATYDKTRITEYATLKALGFGPGFLSLLVFGESMIISAFFGR